MGYANVEFALRGRNTWRRVVVRNSAYRLVLAARACRCESWSTKD